MSGLRVAWLCFFVIAVTLSAMAVVASPPVSAASVSLGLLVGAAAGAMIAPTKSDFPPLKGRRQSRMKTLFAIGFGVVFALTMPQLVTRIPRGFYDWLDRLPSLSADSAVLLRASAFPAGVAAFLTAGALAAWRDLRAS